MPAPPSSSRCFAADAPGRPRPRRSTSLGRRVFVTGTLVALPVVLLAGAWRLGGASAIEDDLIYYLPIRTFVGQMMCAGQWPFWNPLVGMGRSLAADPQAGLWYPFTYLFVVLAPLIAYPVTVSLHFTIAGGGMYRFLRALRHDWRAAFIGAVAFQFCGFLVAHRVHLTMLQSAAWLPWMLLAWQRFTDTGRYRHFALACGLLGLQLLVQHVQISLIGLALLTGYVLCVLAPRKPALWAWYPAGLATGVLLGAVQWFPTWLHLGRSLRGTPAYHLFVENSWWPTSAVMGLFPMVFGVRTPNLWDQPWWGPSHFSEQFAYGSILIFILAGASLRLLRDPSPVAPHRWNREVVFWWAAMGVALLIALGRFSPVTPWLFEIPVYRSLRVPARWILVVSLAMPVLASFVLSAALGQGQTGERHAGERARRSIRWSALRLLPVCAAFCLLAMVAVRLSLGWLADRVTGYRSEAIWSGAAEALRWDNPAIVWPLILMAVTAVLVVRLADRPTGGRWAAVVAILLVDLASVAGFVDVDTRTYLRADLREAPPLAEAIRTYAPEPGQRLLVPRASACYERPIEVLWPQTNVLHDIATLPSYGPLEPTEQRWLFGFMPWGAGEDILGLLRNPDLCRAAGVRFVAVRSDQERRLLAAAMWPAAETVHWERIDPGDRAWHAVRTGDDLRWPIDLERAGIYLLELDAEPVPDEAGRWFVRLETAEGQGLTEARSVEPVDLAMGRRRVRFTFPLALPEADAYVRIKAEQGSPVLIGTSRIARTGTVPADVEPEAVFDPDRVYSIGCGRHPFTHLADLPGNVALYEMHGAAPLCYLAGNIVEVSTATEALDVLESLAFNGDANRTVVVESSGDVPLQPGKGGTVVVESLTPGECTVRVTAPEGGLLVFNQAYDPGWRAFVNGTVQPILRTHLVMQSVAIPPGEHRVQWVFWPRGLRGGLALTVLGAIALTSGAATHRRAGTYNP